MTIVESINIILQDSVDGLTSFEIHSKIVENKLYNFGAKNPIGVVNGELRRHCADLDFPTASPMKYYRITGHDGKKIKYGLLESGCKKSHSTFTNNLANSGTELLPEEKVARAMQEHLSNVKQQLLDLIIDNHPSFFERLVVDLLLQMGYGYDRSSGVVTGASHDNGIDGIISEDKLGLDLIYIQAKRYSASNKVGRKELQAFIGAMGHIQKGVFITSSSFTKEAYEFGTKQQQKNIKLIDGDMLAEFMVKYKIGVESVKEFHIYKIDNDYFQD